MAEIDEIRVGKKGEILPKKLLREISGIKPGDRVIIEARPGNLKIQKILSIEEALKLPKLLEITDTEAEEMINAESRKQEEKNGD